MNSRPDGESARDDHVQSVVDRVRRVLSEFDFQEEIGRGGTAVIFKAREIALDRVVAIKIVTADFAGDNRVERLFLEEARAIARLDHPNIIQIHSVGRAAGSFYLVLQHVRGETLDRILKRETRLAPENALRTAREVATALETAHRHGVIHRDIKPSNVMVRPDASVKIMDFGIAGGHLLTADAEHGLYIGTPVYSSPEQCRMETLDSRTDLYSLGVVLYEMLTGTLPHVGESPEMTIDRVAQEEPTPLSYVAPDLSPEIHALAARLMARDRAARFHDATSVVTAIDRILARGLFYRSASRLLPNRTSRAMPAAASGAAGPMVLGLAVVSLVVSMAVAGIMTDRLLAGSQVPAVEIPPASPRVPLPIVIAPVESDPALSGAGSTVIEREALFALAGLDGVIARSSAWAESAAGHDLTPSGTVEAVSDVLGGERGLIVLIRVRPEGQRLLLEIDLIEVPIRRTVLSLRGSAHADRMDTLASRAADALAAELKRWLAGTAPCQPSESDGGTVPLWIDLGDGSVTAPDRPLPN